MAQEFITPSFYDSTSFGLSYYSAMIAFENYIAANVLRGDASRILFTSTSYAFRARFEQTDRGSQYAGVSSLNFPFANYWYDGYWEDDDRIGSMQASQMMNGTTFNGIKIRNRPVKGKFTVTFYFDTDKEARTASDLMVWAFRPRSVMIATSVKYKNIDVVIPVVIELESTNFNPEFTEKEWLQKNRIIPFNATFTIRSYVVGPHIQTKITNGLDHNFKEDVSVYITEHVKLYFETYKNVPSTGITNDELMTSIDAYFNPAYDISIASLNVSDITHESAKINYEVTLPITASVDSLVSIVVKMVGKADITITDPELIGSIIIGGLSELSNYSAYIFFYLKSGKIKTQTLTFTTANDISTPDNTLDIPLKSLKGLTF